MQDPTVWGLPVSEEQLAPLYTENKDGEVGTGALWFALYGRKGDSMIETEGSHIAFVRCFTMAAFFRSSAITADSEDGKFNRTNPSISGFGALGSATIILSGPVASPENVTPR